MTTDSCILVTRRAFLTGLGASVALAACGGSHIAVLSPKERGGRLRVGSLGTPTDRVLVVIELGGGNDGLSTVVPHASDRYHDLRRSTRIQNPIDLDGDIGLHPNLTMLSDMYRAGEVAIVEGVGVPDPDLSHFTSMDRWWTGTTDSVSQAGWLGRYLDGTVGFENPLAGIVIGPGPTPAMLGDGSFTVAISDASGLTPNVPGWIDDVDELMAMWKGFVPEAPSSIDLTPVQRAIEASVDARESLATALHSTSPGSRRPARTDLTDQLTIAAELIASDVSPTVIYVHGFGDFDTHLEQARRHGELMASLDEALASFFSRLADTDQRDRVTVLTTSEFGRRARDNGGGTDHGTANAQLVIGSSVTGGRYGEAPSLTRLDTNSNMIHTVDFRSLYATVLDGWLETDHTAVLDGEFEGLGFFS
jgi:uncharacterized protein (DUF1501 family)